MPLIREHKVDIISELQAVANDAVQIWPDFARRPQHRDRLPGLPTLRTAWPDCWLLRGA
ncbi:MAG: hypothetical protein IPL05_04800 [Betaproteobacteria bacterium]|nr:hypothetical protein [Betaproteobacteria bacterium]